MPSGLVEVKDEDGNVIGRAFHDCPDCLKGEEHDWSGWHDEYDSSCTHEGEHGPDVKGCRGPRSSEAICIKCGMGAMHHSLMTAEG